MDEWFVYENPTSFSLGLIERIHEILKERSLLQSTTPLILGLSGGSLQKLLGEGLHTLLGSLDRRKCPEEYQKLKVLWSRVMVVLCDERYLPDGHMESNQKSIREHFLSILKNYFDLEVPYLSMKYSKERSVEEAAKDYEFQLRALLHPTDAYPCFDLVLLGMGPDGHTCSIFPQHTSFDRNTHRWVDHVLDSPKPPPERITLTIPVLQHAFTRIFVVTGETKAPIVRDILRNSDNRSDYPAGSLTSLRTYWYLDKEAACLL
jgi:6-phosphogluconolactonase